MKSSRQVLWAARAVCAAAVCGMLVAAAQAGTIPADDPMVPAGLGVGDTFHLAFVTSTGTSAVSADIGDYNTHVTNAANMAGSVVAGRGWTWKAIVSTPTVDAINNTGTNYTAKSPGFPIYRVNLTRIAVNYADFWDGRIAHPLYLTQSSAKQSAWVWTGTKTDGTRSANPVGGAGADVSFGENSFVDHRWIATTTSGGTWDKTEKRYLMYAISEPLTIVAKPASSK